MLNDPSVLEMLRMVFIGYVKERAPKEARGSEHLGDYAYVWLRYGGGAAACGNDHAILLSVLLLCAEDLTPRRGMLAEPVGSFSPPKALIDTQCLMCSRVLDPQYFRVMASNPEALQDHF